jgi:hypothetical protein
MRQGENSTLVAQIAKRLPVRLAVSARLSVRQVLESGANASLSAPHLFQNKAPNVDFR